MKIEDLTPHEYLSLALESLRYELLVLFRPILEWAARRVKP